MHNYHPLGLITLRNGKALKVDASGGSGNGELYDPSAEQWMLLTAPMYYAFNGDSSTIAMLTNGDVLIYGNHFPSYASQFYDPVANTWTPTKGQNNGQISIGRLAALGNGKVLLAGDQFKYGGFNPTCMLYDPSTNT